MAKIWALYEGREPTAGGPWARLPLGRAASLFQLRPEDYVSDWASTPRFGDVDRELTHAGYKHIVVEVEPKEGRKAKWKPGFYRSTVQPKKAFGILIQDALADELGDENVVRVEYEPTTDSHGRDAIRIRVVLAPDAAQRLADGAVLEALVRLQVRLREMREDRIPIIEYATEAELEQNGGSES